MENPYDFIRPVRDPAMFVGRTQLLGEILDGVRRGDSFAITGNTRIGKSSLLFQLRHTLLEQLKQSGHAAIVPVLVRKRDFPHPTPPIICRRIADQFRSILTSADSSEGWQHGIRLFDPQLGDDDAIRAFSEALDAIAQMRHADCRIVLMLDDVDRLNQYRWSRGFFEQLRQLITRPNGVPMTTVVVDSVFPLSTDDARAPLLEIVKVKTLGVLSQAETVELVTKPTGLEHVSPIVSSIVNETGGHPFLVQYLMHQLFEVTDGDLARATLQDLDAIVTRYYDERSDFSTWAARFTTSDHRAYNLIASRPGTTRADLQRELGNADQTSRAIEVLLQTGVVREESPNSDGYRTSAEMFRRWMFDPRRVLELQATQAGPTVLRSAAEARRPSDEVQFTVYRPNVLRPGEWKTMLAFMHLANRRPDAPRDEPSPVEQVQALARQALGKQASQYDHDRAGARSGVPRESEITLVPLVQGLEFRPERRSFLWIDDVHQEQFTVRALPEADGTIARGRLSAFLGMFLLAEVDFAIRVDSGHPTGQNAEPTESSTANMYRRVFASYSHEDAEVVTQFERLVEAMGDIFLRDVRSVRSGMDWRTRIRELIQEADVFQLFWSHNAMRSSHVREEWEYALSLNRAGFVRPTYWEDPLPESPADGLPPEELRRLHFHRLGRSASSSREAEIEVLIAQAKAALSLGHFEEAVACLSENVLSSDHSSLEAKQLRAIARRALEERKAEESRKATERFREEQARAMYEAERQQRELERRETEARQREAEDRERRELEARRRKEAEEERRTLRIPAAQGSVDDVLPTVAVEPSPIPPPRPSLRPEPAPPASRVRAPRSNWFFILVAFAVLASLGLTFVLFFLD